VGRLSMASVYLSQESFLKSFGIGTVSQMSFVFHRLHWPIFCFFKWKQLLDGPDYKGLTIKDFHNALFTSKYMSAHLLDMRINSIQMLVATESLFNRTVYNLTPYGQRLANMMWKVLDTVTTYEKKSISAYVEKLRKMKEADSSLETEAGAVDVEEELIKEIEAQKVQKAITSTGTSSIIDLNKIEVDK